MPPFVGIERTNAHQAVYAAFSRKITVGILTLDQQRRAFNASLLTGKHIQYSHLEPMLFAIATVHAH